MVRTFSIVTSLMLWLCGLTVTAQTVSIGVTEFPLGENAFPSDSECLDPAGCGDEDNAVVDITDPLLRPVSAAFSLRGHRPDLVALNLQPADEIRLTFPAPIVNEDGVDLYLGQALFLGDLADSEGINDMEIRLSSSTDWHKVEAAQFTADNSTSFIITYADPELKQDTLILWFTRQDLSDFGFASGDAISEITIRGIINAAGSGLDAAIVGNLNGAAAGNRAPVADAGTDQTVRIGETALLDGSGSTDADGDLLTFSWTLLSRPTGSSAVISDPTRVDPSFFVDIEGTYVSQLVVNDGTADSAPDTVTVSTMNSAPLADAGPDQTALVGDTVQLDGSGSSDADGDALMFSWSFFSLPPGSAAMLSNTTSIMPTFDVDLAGSYVAQLVVNDGSSSSPPDAVSISTVNSIPVANAGPDQAVTTGDSVRLDGSGSTDADGDMLTFTWALTSIPAGSGAVLAGSMTASPTFVADVDGTFVAQLMVNDGMETSLPSTTTVTAQASPANPPGGGAGGSGGGATETLSLLAASVLLSSRRRRGLKRGPRLNVFRSL